MAFIENGDSVMLMEGSHLKTLYDELWYKEEELMANIEFSSERAKYLQDCNGAREKVISLLANCKDFKSKLNQGRLVEVTDKSKEENKNVNADSQEDTFENLKHVDIIMSHVRNWCTQCGWKGLLDYLELETKVFSKKCIKFGEKYTSQKGACGINNDSEVEANVQELATNNQAEKKEPYRSYSILEFGKDIQEYVTYAINVGLQCARNCGARRRWISKIETHLEMLKQVLQDQNGGNLQGMAEHMSSYKMYMWEFAKHCQKGSIQTDSVAYNTLLQKEHEQFSDMATKRKMDELGLAAEFDNLTDLEKLQVWRGIINESISAFPESKSISKSKSISISSGTSHLLPIEYIFGKGDTTIRDFTKPTFRGANMPDGAALAREIMAKENKQKKSGLVHIPDE